MTKVRKYPARARSSPVALSWRWLTASHFLAGSSSRWGLLLSIYLCKYLNFPSCKLAFLLLLSSGDPEQAVTSGICWHSGGWRRGLRALPFARGSQGGERRPSRASQGAQLEAGNPFRWGSSELLHNAEGCVRSGVDQEVQIWFFKWIIKRCV